MDGKELYSSFVGTSQFTDKELFMSPPFVDFKKDLLRSMTGSEFYKLNQYYDPSSEETGSTNGVTVNHNVGSPLYRWFRQQYQRFIRELATQFHETGHLLDPDLLKDFMKALQQISTGTPFVPEPNDPQQKAVWNELGNPVLRPVFVEIVKQLMNIGLDAHDEEMVASNFAPIVRYSFALANVQRRGEALTLQQKRRCDEDELSICLSLVFQYIRYGGMSGLIVEDTENKTSDPAYDFIAKNTADLDVLRFSDDALERRLATFRLLVELLKKVTDQMPEQPPEFPGMPNSGEGDDGQQGQQGQNDGEGQGEQGSNNSGASPSPEGQSGDTSPAGGKSDPGDSSTPGTSDGQSGSSSSSDTQDGQNGGSSGSDASDGQNGSSSNSGTQDEQSGGSSGSDTQDGQNGSSSSSGASGKDATVSVESSENTNGDGAGQPSAAMPGQGQPEGESSEAGKPDHNADTSGQPTFSWMPSSEEIAHIVRTVQSVAKQYATEMPKKTVGKTNLKVLRDAEKDVTEGEKMAKDFFQALVKQYESVWKPGGDDSERSNTDNMIRDIIINVDAESPHKGRSVTVKRPEVKAETEQRWNAFMTPLLSVRNRFVRDLKRMFEELREGETLRGKNYGRVYGKGVRRIDTDQKIFFRKKAPRDVPQLAVAIIIDRSSSMEGGNIAQCCRAACLVVDVLTELGIPVMVCGHNTEGNGLRFYVNKDFDSKGKAYAVADLTTGGSNRDGYAFLIASELLGSRPEEDKLFLILSDGSPNHEGYSGKGAKKDIKNILNSAKRKYGIETIPCAIGAPEIRRKVINLYDGECLDVDDISALPKLLTKVVRKRLEY